MPERSEQGTRSNPWVGTIIGLTSVAATVGLRIELGKSERDGGEKPNAIVVLLHKAVSRLGSALIFGGLGLALAVCGVNALIENKRQA